MREMTSGSRKELSCQSLIHLGLLFVLFCMNQYNNSWMYTWSEIRQTFSRTLGMLMAPPPLCR